MRHPRIGELPSARSGTVESPEASTNRGLALDDPGETPVTGRRGTKRGAGTLTSDTNTVSVDRRGENKMATDYDAPRRSEADELAEDSLEELKARRNETQSGVVDVDEDATAENFELPGADLSGEELTFKVLPKQADEFTCSKCFLVHHRSRLAEEHNGQYICRDCA